MFKFKKCCFERIFESNVIKLSEKINKNLIILEIKEFITFIKLNITDIVKSHKYGIIDLLFSTLRFLIGPTNHEIIINVEEYLQLNMESHVSDLGTIFVLKINN